MGGCGWGSATAKLLQEKTCCQWALIIRNTFPSSAIPLIRIREVLCWFRRGCQGFACALSPSRNTSIYNTGRGGGGVGRCSFANQESILGPSERKHELATEAVKKQKAHGVDVFRALPKRCAIDKTFAMYSHFSLSFQRDRWPSW